MDLILSDINVTNKKQIY